MISPLQVRDIPPTSSFLYLYTYLEPTENEVRAQLAVEEDRQSTVDGTIQLHAVTASALLSMLLDLEDQQYVPSLSWDN